MRHVWKEALNAKDSLWRYFKTGRLLESLETQTLYFAAATQFEDSFEGAVAVQSPDIQGDPRYAVWDSAERAFKELKRLTKVTCWHRASHESDAMWKLYADSLKGVAICTTPERIAASLKPFRLREDYGVEDLWGGCVHYADLTKVRLNVTMLEQFYFKHIAFEWEKEFRLAISVRMAEEFGVRVPEKGILVQFDPEALIEKVVFGPQLPETDRDGISTTLKSLKIEDRTVNSTLMYTPRYV